MNYFADGSDLREKREDRCLSLSDLSSLSGVSKGSIGNFETGTRGLSRKAQKALYDILVLGKTGKQLNADDNAVIACLHCVSKDKEIAELRRQVALLIETNASLAQGRSGAAPASGVCGGGNHAASDRCERRAGA
jgi:transcriptional regulator with XRE-family HTH domain